jgi:hypothetical protein
MANDTPNTPQQPEQEKPEIEPLSDQALEDVSGGLSRIEPSSSDSCCSCTSCS